MVFLNAPSPRPDKDVCGVLRGFGELENDIVGIATPALACCLPATTRPHSPHLMSGNPMLPAKRALYGGQTVSTLIKAVP